MALIDCLKKAGFSQEEIDALRKDFVVPEGQTEEQAFLDHISVLEAQELDQMSSIREQLGLETPEPVQATEEFKLTPEAEEVLSNEKGVPAFISKKLEKVAKDNGVEITDSMTPNDVIEALRDKKKQGQTKQDNAQETQTEDQTTETQESTVQVDKPSDVNEGDVVKYGGINYNVANINDKGGFDLVGVDDRNFRVKDARITDTEFEGKIVSEPAPESPQDVSEPVSPETTPPTPEEENVAQEAPTEPTKEEKKASGRFIKRVLDSPKVSEKTKGFIRDEVDDTKDKKPITNEQAEAVVNEIIDNNGRDLTGLLNTFENLQGLDPNIWFREEGIGLMLGNKLAYELEKLGEYDAASRVDLFTDQQAGRIARTLVRLNELATGEQRVAAFARNSRMLIAEGKERTIGDTTVGEKIDNVNRLTNPSPEAISNALNSANIPADSTFTERVKEGKKLTKEGLKDLRKSLGLGVGVPLSNDTVKALTKIMKGLYLQFSGNVRNMREGFKNTLKDSKIDAEDAWAQLSNKGVLERIKKEQGLSVQEIINNHIANPKAGVDFKKALTNAGISSGLANRISKALHDEILADLQNKRGQIGKELEGGRDMSKPKIKNKKLEDILEAAANGFLSNRDMTSVLSKTFSLGDLTIEQHEKLNDLIEKVNNSTSKRQKTKHETNLITEITKLETGSQKQFIDFIQAMYYTNILSGLTTQSTALFGATFHLSGEVGVELARGVVEGRTKFTLRAFRKAFSKQGFRAGMAIYPEILKTGSVDLTFADVPTKSLTPLDRLINSKFKLKSLRDIPTETFRAIMLLPTVIYRNLIAVDAILKSGLTESFAHISAYNKVLNEEVKGGAMVKGSPEFYDKINELLGETDVDALKDQVAEEISQGLIAPNESSTRLRELIDEGRDDEIIIDANERVLQALLMNTKVSGTIPRNLTNWLGGAMRIKNDDSLSTKLGKLFVKTFVPIVRVPSNNMSRSYQFTPLNLIEREVIGRLPGKIGEMGRTRRTFDISKDQFAEGEISVEERTRQLYRAALGTSAMIMVGSFLLGFGDEEEKEPLIRVTGAGTGDWKENIQRFGKDFKDYRIQLNLKKLGLETRPGTTYSSGIKYGDTPLMMVLAPIGHIMDQRGLGKTNTELEAVNLISAGMRAAYDGSFDLSFVFVNDFLTALGEGIDMVEEGDNALSGLGKLAKIGLGAKVQGYNEYLLAKEMNRRMQPFLLPNLYKQSTLIYKDLIDKPIEKTESTLDMLARDVMFAERLVDKAITDKFGYPIQPDFDTPFLPDFVEDWVDNRIGPGEPSTPEWDALKGKNFTLSRDYDGNRIKGIDDVLKEQLRTEYQTRFRQLFNNRLDKIEKLNGEELNNFIKTKIHEPSVETAKKRVLGGTDKLAERVEKKQRRRKEVTPIRN